ncbi:MAG: fumarylacetoacetase [Phycisphaerales bacterium]|nr:fumarylacetoacetase [Phycisphaerales bacterium]
MSTPDPTLNPDLQSWVESANVEGTDFPLQNLPYGIFSSSQGSDRIGVAIGDMVLDVHQAIEELALQDLPPETACALSSSSLNQFMGLGSRSWRSARRSISSLLTSGADPHPHLLLPRESISMKMPAAVGDYTDFYASRHHATNVGRMFRPDGEPLLPNYLNLPVGYHGRASTLVVSGTNVKRPMGQLKPDDGPPVFGPCRLLDYEMEFGAFVGAGNPHGHRIEMASAMDQLFGLVILNDWSARDVQKWEYQPLGPFNAKNFASSISPWVVTMEALSPFRKSGPDREPGDPDMLDYLVPVTDDVLDVTCEVHIASSQMREKGQSPVLLSKGTLADLTWTFTQMLAHHTSTGCAMRPGDLLGSGTVSGTGKESRGCLLELTWRGTEPVELPDGTQRKFLLDGDELTMSAYCEAEGARRIGLGTCTGVIQPAS